MKGIFPIDKFRELRTPFYYYDTKVLRDTLDAVNKEVARYERFDVHYAVKANANSKVLTIIRESGMGADCVSGGEIRAAVKAGFPAQKIVFAGVGKADWEIELGLDYNIFCFNVESIPELESSTNWLPRKAKWPMSLSVSIRMWGRIPMRILLPDWQRISLASAWKIWIR